MIKYNTNNSKVNKINTKSNLLTIKDSIPKKEKKIIT